MMVPVSVIIPAYKRVDQTIRTIELVRASDGMGSIYDIELIVSDATPDDSLKKAIDAACGQSVRYTKPERPGIAANKNHAAKAATHPILIFCDSDMEVEPGTIRAAVGALKTHETAAAAGGRVVWRGGPQDGQNDRPRPEDRLQTVGSTTYTEAIYSRFMITYADVFWEVGGYDEAVFTMRGEGSDLSIRYWRQGYPLVYDASIVTHHVYDAPDAAAVRTDHTNEGIARDLMLLMHKYGMTGGDYSNFNRTIKANFGDHADVHFLTTFPGVQQALEQANASIAAFRQNEKPRFDFTCVEVFSDQQMFTRCINDAGERLKQVRGKVFV